MLKKVTLPIIEIFNSVSGEGITTGIITTFIRLAGCNLRCVYCDTKYSYDDKQLVQQLSTDDVLNQINKFQCNHLIITGGEPLEENSSKRSLPLFLSSKGFDVRIETNGACKLYTSEELSKYSNCKIDYTMDVKTPSSGMTKFNLLENINLLDKNDELKFVIKDSVDMYFCMDIINTYKEILSKNKITINFSPVFLEIMPSRLVEMIKGYNKYFKDNNLIIRFNLQIHKYIWPASERGV